MTPIQSIFDIEIHSILYLTERNNDKINILQFLVTSVKDPIVTARKMANTGTMLPESERILHEFHIDSLIEKEAKYHYEEVSERESWPKSVNEAIGILLNSFDESELAYMQKMEWDQFYFKYMTWGTWIRNEFGLWRGNFNLLIDCKIDDINADNASTSILYHFWEFVVFE